MGRFIDFLLSRPPKELITNNIYQKKDSKLSSSHSLIFDEIQKIKNILLTNKNEKSSGYSGLDNAVEILLMNEIGVVLINEFISVMQDKCTIKELNDIEFIKKKLLLFIRSKLKIYQDKEQKTKQRMIVLVGTTGIGKTSSIFKLVSYFEQIDQKSTSIRVACLDNQKLGTKEYLEIIKGYTGIDGQLFINHDDFFGYVRKGLRPEILLVDTAGKNPKNKKEILNIAQSLSSILEKAEVFLVLSANINENDMKLILEEFSLLKYNGIIITKIDESLSPTRLMGVCMEKQIPIAFLSDGKDLLERFSRANYEKVIDYFRGL